MFCHVWLCSLFLLYGHKTVIIFALNCHDFIISICCHDFVIMLFYNKRSSPSLVSGFRSLASLYRPTRAKPFFTSAPQCWDKHIKVMILDLKHCDADVIDLKRWRHFELLLIKRGAPTLADAWTYVYVCMMRREHTILLSSVKYTFEAERLISCCCAGLRKRAQVCRRC